MMKKKRFLTVYTVSSNEMHNGSLLHGVAGSYLYRGDAIRECTDMVIDTIKRSRGKCMSLIEDVDLGEKLRDAGIDPLDACDVLEGNSVPKRGDNASRKVFEMAREYISDLLGSDGCVSIGDERFDVDENDVECSDGLQTWTCITSGRDDENHDPEFEQAFPEVFLSEDAAVECAIDDLKSCLEGYSRKEIRTIVDEAKDRINKDGHFEFDLNDSKTRIWDVWSTPIDIGQGRPVKRKTRR